MDLHLYFLALDYSKAFDSIPHEKLIECLIRIGAPKKIVDLVQAIYTNPRFRIKFPKGASDEFTQDIGIRQGCPPLPVYYRHIVSNDGPLERPPKHRDSTPPQAPLTPCFNLQTTPF